MIEFILLIFLLIGIMCLYEPTTSYDPKYRYNPRRKKEIKDPELIRLRKKLEDLESVKK
ncbi:MAG: hypothetical protein ACOCQD_01680 [archaeon]